MRHHFVRRVAARALALSMLAWAGSGAGPAHAADPSYTWKNVKIGGSGYVTGLIAHPGQQGLFYAKTDVGGAYRYEAGSRTWTALNDWTPEKDFNLSGVDSIAVDPNDASKLYMVTGMYHWPNSNAVFLLSSDRGSSFTKVPLTFTAGANSPGRQVGERLQVDPNFGSTLFYGTGNSNLNPAANGLWKSTNGGYNWSKVGGFPALSSDGTGAGVSFVAFYKQSGSQGRPTPTIFAGVNTKTAADSGAVIYRSTDGGNTWSALWGGPVGLLPQRGQVGPDGVLYVTYSRYGTWDNQHYYGPDGLLGGQVWKYDIHAGKWSYITPPNNGSADFGFVGLSVDPSRASTLLVNSMNRYDDQGETLYRSTNGGATWTDISQNASFDVRSAPWTATEKPVRSFGNWGGSLLDPFDPDHAFVTYGGGIWETRNLTAPLTNWAFGQDGVEETAVSALISPTANQWNAYPLISGAWDVCGFTHANLAVAPSTTHANPTCSKVTSLDYARHNSTIVVRVQEDGWNRSPTKHYGAISWNGGYSWSPFPSNGPTQAGGGRVAVSASGGTILWAPPDAKPVYSHDAGYSWNTVAALPQKSHVVADGANPDFFYAYFPDTGKFYASADKAVTWATTDAVLPQWGGRLAATPGRQGELWLSVYNGLYRSSASGWGAWTKMPKVSVAKALGFGKEAPGSTYPTLYLSGTVDNVQGIFRSSDGGANWVRINNDQNQWAGTDVITGDPKTFGTVYLGTGNGRGIIYGTSSN